MVSYLVDVNQYHSPPKNNPKNYSNNLVFKCMCDLISNFAIGIIILKYIPYVQNQCLLILKKKTNQLNSITNQTYLKQGKITQDVMSTYYEKN